MVLRNERICWIYPCKLCVDDCIDYRATWKIEFFHNVTTTYLLSLIPITDDIYFIYFSTRRIIQDRCFPPVIKFFFFFSNLKLVFRYQFDLRWIILTIFLKCNMPEGRNRRVENKIFAIISLNNACMNNASSIEIRYSRRRGRITA